MPGTYGLVGCENSDTVMIRGGTAVAGRQPAGGKKKNPEPLEAADVAEGEFGILAREKLDDADVPCVECALARNFEFVTASP